MCLTACAADPRSPITTDCWHSPHPLLLHLQNYLTIQAFEGAYYYIYRFPDAPKFTPLQEEALRWGCMYAQPCFAAQITKQ